MKQEEAARLCIGWLEEHATKCGDEVIAKRFRDIAAWVRKTGFATKRIFTLAAHYGIRRCVECGGKAIYRSGARGACSKHKGVLAAGQAYSLKRRDEQKYRGIENNFKERDTETKKAASLHKLTLCKTRDYA